MKCPKCNNKMAMKLVTAKKGWQQQLLESDIVYPAGSDVKRTDFNYYVIYTCPKDGFMLGHEIYEVTKRGESEKE